MSSDKQNFIKSGEFFFSTKGEIVMTTLGSCVAFCVYDSVLKIGGMVHYLLPNVDCASLESRIMLNEYNFGDFAIPRLLKMFKKNGSLPQNLEVSIFGGGFNLSSDVSEVAKGNVECAKYWIKLLKLHFKTEKIFCNHGLKVKFCTNTGEILVSHSRESSQISRSDELWAIGSSTGGTEVLRELSLYMDVDLPPIVIVQHMPEIFTKTFAESLNSKSKIIFKEASSGDLLVRGHAYIAPGGKQMGVIRTKRGFEVLITDDPPINRFCPSVDYLFHSICDLQKRCHVTAFILTGMGSDGALGMKKLHEQGAFTIVQDESSSTVFGMPKAAIELNAVDKVLSISQMTQFILSYKIKKIA